jgi:tetratricopeptide (TPR) repeat protein
LSKSDILKPKCGWCRLRGLEGAARIGSVEVGRLPFSLSREFGLILFNFSRWPRFRSLACILLLLTGIGLVAVAEQGKTQSPPAGHSAGVQGHVHDSGGKPVAKVTVSLQFMKDASTETWTTRTDSAGAFRFAGMGAGNYTLHTGETGDELAMAKSVELTENETKKVDLILDAAPDLSSGNELSAAAKAPQFFGDSKFTVAGIAAATSSAGLGPDAGWRNSEELVRDAAALSSSSSSSSAPVPSSLSSSSPLPAPGAGSSSAGKALAPNSATEGNLLQEGAEIQAEIVQEENAEGGGAPGEGANDEKSRGDLKLDVPTRQKRAELYHRLAAIDERLDNPLEAAHEYERAAELAPSERNLFDWGMELLTHRALEPATDVLTKGSATYPQSTRMLIGLGVAWYARGSYERASDYLAKAEDLAPNEAAAYLFMGKMLSSETAPSAETMERLARFARLAPGNALASYYYAVGLWKQSAGVVDEARSAQMEQLLLKASELDPKSGVAQLQLGLVYAQRGDGGRAIAAFKKAIEISPELEEAHYRLAISYKKAGDEAGAEKELALHEQLAKQAAEQAERERGEIQEFVITLKSK